MTNEEKLAKAQADKEAAQAKWNAMPKWYRVLVKIIFGALIFIIGVFIVDAIISPGTESMPDTTYAYSAVKELVKSDQYNLQQAGVNEMSFPLMDFHAEYLNDSTYLIVSHIDYKNNFGVNQKFGYKARIKFLGGDKNNTSSWQLVYFEEYNY